MQNHNDVAQIKIRLNDSPDFRYVSGKTVYQEQFVDTKLIGRYWSSTGRMMDKCEFPAANPDIPQQAFIINMDGQSLDWDWSFVEAQQQDNSAVISCLLYTSPSPRD